MFLSLVITTSYFLSLSIPKTKNPSEDTFTRFLSIHILDFGSVLPIIKCPCLNFPSKSIAKAFEAGSVRINSPSIVEVDAIRAIADGVEIFRAGKLVFLTEEIPPQYLYKVSNDDPELLEVLENLEEE